MQTYYIEIEGQCSNVLAVIKVKAENEDEAKLKALKALHATEDIYSISKQEAQNLVDDGEVDYMLDEDGCEIDPDEDDVLGDKYVLYMQDESGFENTYIIYDEETALEEAERIWENGEGGYCKVSVHQIRNSQDEDDICEANEIWYIDHHMEEPRTKTLD